MKPILSVKVQRGVELKEWIPAKDQATLDGFQDFKRRQEERRRKAQGTPAQVQPIRRLP